MNPFLEISGTGKQSRIYDYCKQAQKKGHGECIWVCTKNKDGWIAQDIAVDPELSLKALFQLYPWWKRVSLYSIRSIREVEIRFLDCDPQQSHVNVIVLPFDLQEKSAELRQRMKEERGMDFENGCGYHMDGEFDHTEREDATCANSILDRDLFPYCRVRVWYGLRLRLDHYRWMPTMVQYFWHNKMGTEGLRFLRESGFVTSYDALEEDRFDDAANPYGKVVNAFMIVEGWQVRYLLLLVGIGLLLSVFVVSVATVVGRSLETGLTAGSYALGLATLILAAISLLSAIL